jgi:uncharacterized HAD superfamily protein
MDDLIEYAVVYVSGRRSAALVDHYAETLPRPRGFQWNLMHHPIISRSCFDIDGILCRDPTPAENDDGVEYRKFLCDTTAQFIPTVRIGHVVTGRLEKYRSETEEWLRRAGIEYGELHMLDGVTARERRAERIPPKFKARIYRETKSALFYESSREEAYEIANLSGRAVYCTEIWRMIYPGQARSETLLPGVPPFRVRAKGQLLDVSMQLKRKLHWRS